ncbi:MAG TPA: type II toxin-antitoxin system CcdA family antitoxin [Microvirga sp.]|jgi:hypothetical protein|nr:type II toxin-antitoxin system CcdA family antitoxin [Microvirga sp.]
MDYGDRATIQVSLDRRIVDDIEAAGLDAARVAEELLRRYARDLRSAAMTDADRQTLQDRINADVAWYNRFVDEHGPFGQSLRNL